MSTVFANGTFDILHPGHYQLLTYCRYLAAGDPVIVAIDADKRVTRQKGRFRPYYNQEERRNLLMMLTTDGKLDARGFGKFLVDWVDVFETDDELYKLIEKHKPDYIIKGADWKGKKVIGSELAQVHLAPTYFKDFFSTSAIEQRILQKHKKRSSR
jgi:cytidyltransferase-like protein